MTARHPDDTGRRQPRSHEQGKRISAFLDLQLWAKRVFRSDQAVVAVGFTYLLLFALCTLAWAYIPA
jgi:hypothetical protein